MVTSGRRDKAVASTKYMSITLSPACLSAGANKCKQWIRNRLAQLATRFHELASDYLMAYSGRKGRCSYSIDLLGRGPPYHCHDETPARILLWLLHEPDTIVHKYSSPHRTKGEETLGVAKQGEFPLRIFATSPSMFLSFALQFGS